MDIVCDSYKETNKLLKILGLNIKNKNSDRLDLIKYILHKIIYPIHIIKYNKNNSLTSIGKTTLSNIKLINDTKFDVPNGLYISKVFPMDLNKVLNTLLHKFFKSIDKNYIKKIQYNYMSESLGLESFKNNMKNHSILYDTLYIIIKSLYKQLYPNFKKEKIEKYIDNSFIKISFYGKKFKNTGMKQHRNSLYFSYGPTSVISFSNSVLDFVPFYELKEERAFRVIIPQNYAVTFDNSLRYLYTHGVPVGIDYGDNGRFMLNIRHPILSDKNKCNKKIENIDCYKSIMIPSLKLKRTKEEYIEYCKKQIPENSYIHKIK